MSPEPPAVESFRYAVTPTPVGAVGLVHGRRGYARVLLPGPGGKTALLRRIRKEFPDAVPDETALADGIRAVEAWAAGEPLPKGLPLDLGEPTPFTRKVYGVLRRIRRGKVLTYGEVAEKAGHPGAHRAVGSALARNPLPIFVPCHRVVQSGGGLGGFTAPGGLRLKERMLELEGVL